MNQTTLIWYEAKREKTVSELTWSRACAASRRPQRSHGIHLIFTFDSRGSDRISAFRFDLDWLDLFRLDLLHRLDVNFSILVIFNREVRGRGFPSAQWAQVWSITQFCLLTSQGRDPLIGQEGISKMQTFRTIIWMTFYYSDLDKRLLGVFFYF